MTIKINYEKLAEYSLTHTDSLCPHTMLVLYCSLNRDASDETISKAKDLITTYCLENADAI